MKEGQDQIFYLAGTSKENVEKSPLIERVIKKGYPPHCYLLFPFLLRSKIDYA